MNICNHLVDRSFVNPRDPVEPLFLNNAPKIPQMTEPDNCKSSKAYVIILGMTIAIAIGSTNPVKVAATDAILGKAFPTATFRAVAVASGVQEQPWGDDQTRTGAFNRATRALEITGATFGVGLEGGVVDTSVGLMTCAWCAIVDGTGKVGYGGGVHILLPAPVATALRRQGELGPAMDVLVNEHNTKQGRGAVGILTNGLSSRQAAYEQLVAMAAAPFVTGFYT
jgi:inosine/xanthosine triphosphatase